jgi:ubiquinone/menaquinone biosynthesis C-methylase UbiE
MVKEKSKEKHGAPSGLDFGLMSLTYKIRDFLRPRDRIIEDVGIKTCSQVLDYGCGPGGYVMPVIRLIGEFGGLYALDVNPLAVRSVQKLAAKKNLSNVRAILSDCATGLPPDSIDVVLLYDILHDLEDRDKVLAELHRVLKPDGILSVSDHHLKEDEINSAVTGKELFKLKSKGKNTLSFAKDIR